RDAMWFAGCFKVLQRSNLFNFKGCVFAEMRYRRERHAKVVRAAPYAPRSLIYFAVENDHLPIQPFECADAEVTVFQESRGRDGTRIHTFDESRKLKSGKYGGNETADIGSVLSLQDCQETSCL